MGRNQCYPAGREPIALTDDIDLIYAELHKIAAIHLSRSVSSPSLQPTLLVNEAWIRLSGKGFKSRTHFLALASRTMRMVLIDAVRARTAQKRQATPEFSSGNLTLPLDKIIEVDRVLTELASRDVRKAQVVEMRFFGGLEFPEIAEALDVSISTVKRDWEFSRSWLFSRLASGSAPPPAPGI